MLRYYEYASHKTDNNVIVTQLSIEKYNTTHLWSKSVQFWKPNYPKILETHQFTSCFSFYHKTNRWWNIQRDSIRICAIGEICIRLVWWNTWTTIANHWWRRWSGRWGTVRWVRFLEYQFGYREKLKTVPLSAWRRLIHGKLAGRCGRSGRCRRRRQFKRVRLHGRVRHFDVHHYSGRNRRRIVLRIIFCVAKVRRKFFAHWNGIRRNV